MKYTPFGIKNQEFNRTVRGYDKDEVRAFLEGLADEFERLQSDNDKLKNEIESLAGQVKEFNKIEKNLQNTLLTAQESSTKAVDSAKKQAVLILKETELKAAQMIEQAKENANSIRGAVLKLREEKRLLLATLTAMVETQTSLMEMSFTPVDKAGTKKKKAPVPKEDDKLDINTDDILEKLL